ncbi:hypothetical protein KABACHOK_02450 [Brevundimonas phage vB_BpoS-Kabachok]|uniref:Uncharacterized protein n=1 Tax=Brevundimonas phage vB_BpoS-Kabachok TaxID=2948600 RepID=A0A9E7SJW1_9CAUD|nr:hypothetical protein KABACHOK_02450 [Brevundimonas phage vB_BpoS-Kabachok]
MSNSRNKRTIEFDVTDAPMLMQAMGLAAATAMMCGHPGARKRFDQYKAMFKAFVPPEADLFDDEDWAQMGMALAKAKAFRVIADLDRWDKAKKARGEYVGRYTKLALSVEIDVGDDTYTVAAKYGVKLEPEGDPRVRAVYDVLADLAPMDCQGSCHDRFEFA